MQNIRVIKTGINVSKILNQIKQYPDDWGSQKSIKDSQSLLDRGYPELDIGVLQLIVGGVKTKDEFVGDTDICIKTPAYNHHTEMVRFLKRHFKAHHRCGFLSLPIGGEVGMHIDEGKYYLTRDRYHLSIQGTYQYTVGDESVIVVPGTLLWFNNKLLHGTKNIGDDVRITFVFDVPHHKSNP